MRPCSASQASSKQLENSGSFVASAGFALQNFYHQSIVKIILKEFVYFPLPIETYWTSGWFVILAPSLYHRIYFGQQYRRDREFRHSAGPLLSLREGRHVSAIVAPSATILSMRAQKRANPFLWLTSCTASLQCITS